MIAPKKPVRRQASPPDGHRQFLAMLPVIGNYADHAFRHLDPEGREDAVHEVLANAVVAFARLVELGKPHLAYPTVLARYGVARLRQGRRVGNRLRIGEVLSEYAQRQKGFAVERLDRFEERRGCWQQIVVEDRRAGPAEVACLRIDFADWLALQPKRNRQIAESLAVGDTPCEVARRFSLSQGRISQLRRALRESWNAFQGEEPAAAIA